MAADKWSCRQEHIFAELDLSDVTISNCLVRTPPGGIRFGPTGDLSRITNVTVSNCVIHADAALLFTSAYKKDYWEKGIIVENVAISNIIIDANAPLWMGVAEKCAGPCGFRNIIINHVSGQSRGGCSLIGTEKSIIENITLSDIRLANALNHA